MPSTAPLRRACLALGASAGALFVLTPAPASAAPPAAEASRACAAIEKANCSDRRRNGHNFSGKVMWLSNFSGASLVRASFYRTNLSSSNFSGADLSRADLRYGDRTKGRWAGANLTGARLARADFYGTNLRGANLRGARLSHTKFDGADLTNADLSGTSTASSSFYGATFCNTRMPRGVRRPSCGNGRSWDGADEPGRTGGSGDRPVAVFNLTNQPLVEPGRFFLTANSGPRLEELRWESWGGQKAKATGIYVSDCASCGPEERKPALVTYSKPKPCRGYDRPVYRKGVLVTISPDGSERQSRLPSGFKAFCR